MSRPTWDETIFGILDVLKNRATCPRLHTACLAVNDENQILGVGYNGSLRGEDHCDDVGCEMIDGHCKRTVHGEQNLVSACARNGISLKGSTVYVLFTPCYDCRKVLTQAGVKRVIWRGTYKSDDGKIEYEQIYARDL